jgi:hypothetical protein
VSARIGPEILQKLERYLHLLNDRTPETQQADDDLAVGRLVQAVSESPYAADTLIIVTEDDCQDGPDDVDSHRATAYVVGRSSRIGTVPDPPLRRSLEDPVHGAAQLVEALGRELIALPLEKLLDPRRGHFRQGQAGRSGSQGACGESPRTPRAA